MKYIENHPLGFPMFSPLLEIENSPISSSSTPLIYKEWDWIGISQNPNLTKEFFEKYLTERLLHPSSSSEKECLVPNYKRWDWRTIFLNSPLKTKINIKYIEEKLALSNSYDGKCPLDVGEGWNFLSEFIVKYCPSNSVGFWGVEPNKCKDLIFNFFEKYIDKDWNWSYISKMKNLPIELILKYPKKNWDWWRLSKKRDLPLYVIETLIDKPWDWGEISWNENLTTEFIEKHPDEHWNNYGIIQKCLNLTPRFLMKNQKIMWYFHSSSSNYFYNIKKIDRLTAAITIQRFWRKHGAFPRWKRKIYDSNVGILYNPRVKGIKFLEAREDWLKRI